MTRTLRVFLALGLLAIVMACGGGTTTPSAKAKTTLLVYMVASDLESRAGEATANIEEMMRVGSTPDVNIILQTGGANKDGWRTVQRKKVFKGGLGQIEDIGQPSMAEPATLRDFVDWGMSTYPAERYMLVLWNHGGGPNNGFGYDEVADSIMELPKLQGALAAALGDRADKLELIGFDACLMASVEIAHALAPFANYLVASQELEPGGGWDWEVLLRRLVAKPLVSGKDLGKTLADGFYAKSQREGAGEMVTLSVTDLKRIPELVAAMDSVASSWTARLTREGADAWTLLAYVRQHALDFTSAKFFGPFTDVVDIRSFLGDASIAADDGQRARLHRAIDAAVTYQVYSPSTHPLGPSGLSMYFPVRSAMDDKTQALYAGLEFSMPVKQWVAQYMDMARQNIVAAPQVGQPGRSGSEVFASLSNSHFSSGFATLETESGVVFALKRARSKFVNGIGQLDTVADTGWFSLGGTPVMLLPDEAQDQVEGEVFTIPVLVPDPHNPQGAPQSGLLNVVYSRDQADVEQYLVTAFYPNQLGDSTVVQRSGQLMPGSRLIPMGFSISTGTWVPLTGLTITVPDDLFTEPWLVQKGPLNLPNTRLRLGVIDFLARLHFSGLAP